MGLPQILKLEKLKGESQTINKVRIASASILPEKWNKPVNWLRIETQVQRAAVEGSADVVVTPEGILEGYVINEVNAETDPIEKKILEAKLLKVAEPLDGTFITKARQLSRELQIHLILGFLEKRKRRIYNTAILIDPDGDIIGRYSKTHFAQGYETNPDFYTPGDDYPVFDTQFGKVGMLICYDRQLPEPARILAIKGAQVLFVPAYGSYTDANGWNTVLLRARAYENRVPLIFCNPFQSLLIDRHGDVKAIGKAGDIVYIDIDTSPDKYNGRFRNRRPKTYKAISK